ncbi:MAG: tetratricopeptide repeat protein [Candidatus Cloacimonetes bacterium]|nr:tetratricopeptide repeat protein [Candidatus Cloacimonadota bacterium]
MKKIIILLACLIMMVTLAAEPIKVALGSIEKKDRDSDYIVNRLLKSDFEDLFKKNEKYELMNIKKTMKLIEKASPKEFLYLKKEEKLEIARQIGAEILIWGDVTSTGNDNYRLSINILSTKTNDFVNTVFTVAKNTDERIAAMNENLFCELDNSCQGSTQMIMDIAMQQYSTRNYEQAAESFLAVLGAEPENVQAVYYLGAINYIERNYEQSIDYFRRAHELDPGNDDILNQLSIVYTKVEMYEEAVSALEQISDFAENPALGMRIAGLYKNIEYYEEAQNAYENVIALTDTMDAAYLELGNLLYDLEYYEEALPYLEEASSRYPNDDLLNKKLANTYKKTGKINSAIQQYKDLIASNPNNLKAYYNLVNAYTSINDYQKALNTALQLEKIDAKNPNVYIMLSNSYSSLKKYDEAEKAAKKVLKLNPEDYQAYRILSEVYQGKGYIEYEKYLDYDEQTKGLYGKEADAMIEKRDSARQKANELFTTSQNYLEQAKGLTTQASELGYIKERAKTLKQLLEATKKDFF